MTNASPEMYLMSSLPQEISEETDSDLIPPERHSDFIEAEPRHFIQNFPANDFIISFTNLQEQDHEPSPEVTNQVTNHISIPFGIALGLLSIVALFPNIRHASPIQALIFLSIISLLLFLSTLAQAKHAHGEQSMTLSALASTFRVELTNKKGGSHDQ